jgi:hypothetical protein
MPEVPLRMKRMIAQPAHQVCQLPIIRGDHSAFAGGDDLVGIKRKRSGQSEAADALVGNFGAVRLGGVLDQK